MPLTTSPDEKAEAIRNFVWNNDDLLKNSYKEYVQHPLAGHCYVASEAYYHLLEDQTAWTPHWLSVEWDKSANVKASMTHWFLKNKQTGQIVDLTAEQFDPLPIEPNYDGGTGAGFQTTEPSERAERVLKAI